MLGWGGGRLRELGSPLSKTSLRVLLATLWLQYSSPGSGRGVKVERKEKGHVV